MELTAQSSMAMAVMVSNSQCLTMALRLMESLTKFLKVIQAVTSSYMGGYMAEL